MAPAQLKNSLLVAGVLAGVGGAALFRLASPSATVPAPPSGAPQRHVLFIGNSYTYVNDLPAMLRAVAASDGTAPMDIETDEAVRGGALLEETFSDPAARAKLTARHWDFVVLQEESLMTTRPDLIARARHGFEEWGAAIRAAGAVPVVLETWARQPGSADYGNGIAAAYHLTDAPAMQAGIDSVLGDIALNIGAITVPAGDVWGACETAGGVPDLYQADGSHPSPAGTYLTALVLYRALTGHVSASGGFVPDGLSGGDARSLAACAGR